MQDAQFVFVTEDARVLAVLMDGCLEDVTERSDLLPRARIQTNPTSPQYRPNERIERRRVVFNKFAT